VNGCREGGSKGLFSLPKNEELAKLWIEGIKSNNNLLKLKNVYVCFRHFQQDDIKTTGKFYRVNTGR